MSELIQQFSVPAKTTIAREFPVSDDWTEDPFLIKFGDFQVQIMDKNMKTIQVFLDNHLFVDGKLVEGSPGDSFPSNNNNHHCITADEPLSSTTTLGDHFTDQGQDLQECVQSSDVTTADDLRKTVSLCNRTIADLIDKKLLKFTKSKRGFLKKQTTTFSQEREKVLETLHRLTEQSRQVMQNEDNMKRQLGIKQRDQVILKENIKDINTRWAEKLEQKDTECQKILEEAKIMAQLVKERDHTLHDVTMGLSNAKSLVKSLEAANGDMGSKNNVLLDVIAKDKEKNRKIVEAKDRLLGEKKSLESGVKIMEEKMKAQRQFYEDQMTKTKENLEMEIFKMKKTMDAEIVRRDEQIQELHNQLTEEQHRHEAVKRENAVVRIRMEQKETQNEDLKKEIKVKKESLDLVTEEKAKLILSHQGQVDQLHHNVKIVKEKLVDEEKRLAILNIEKIQMEKKHLDQAAEEKRRYAHLQEKNNKLQKEVIYANDGYYVLYREFEKLQCQLAEAEKKIALCGELEDRQLISDSKQIHPLTRIKELESELVQKVNEQEDMRVLIRRLKKDLSKAEKDLAQVTSEKQDLISRREKENTDHKREVNDLKKTFEQEKLVETKVYEKRNSESRRLAKKMTDLHRQLKISYKDLQKSKVEADEEIERLKASVSEMEDELDEMDEELENCEQDIEDLEDDLDDAEYEIEQNEKQIRKLKTQVEHLQKTKKNLERKLRGFQSSKT